MIEEQTTSQQPIVTIGYMRPEQIKDILEIEKVSFGTPWSESAYRNEVDNKSAVYLTATTPDGRLAAYAGVWIVIDEAHVTTIAVNPEMRGMKLGKAMMIALLDMAAEYGATRSTLEVRPSNTPAIELYRKLGYHPVGRRKGYYHNNGEDAIIMWLDRFDLEQYVEEADSVRHLFQWAEGAGPKGGG